IISTWPPRSRSRPAITAAILSSPSRLLLPDSIETSSLSVLRSGAFSLAASECTGSSGAAHALMAKATQTIERATNRKLQDRDINASASNNVAVLFPHVAPNSGAVPTFMARPADAALKNEPDSAGPLAARLLEPLLGHLPRFFHYRDHFDHLLIS